VKNGAGALIIARESFAKARLFRAGSLVIVLDADASGMAAGLNLN
jgi:hypothetical protein